MDWFDVAQDRGSWCAVAIAIRNLRDTQNGKDLWTSWGSVRFLGMAVVHGVSYLGERDVSVDTPSVNRRQYASWGWNNYVSRKIVGRICLIIAGCTWDGKFPVAQNRTSVTRHEGRATEIGDSSVGRSTLEVHPQNSYGSCECFSENPESG